MIDEEFRRLPADGNEFLMIQKREMKGMTRKD
jgi:hypothetical protein